MIKLSSKLFQHVLTLIFTYWEKEILKGNLFNSSEIKFIRENYIEITNNIIKKTFEEYESIDDINEEINKIKFFDEPFSDWLHKSINLCKKRDPFFCTFSKSRICSGKLY